MRNLFLFTVFSINLIIAGNAIAIDEKITQKIEEHLNSIQTFQAAFQQYTPGEIYTSGMFYFKQPRKFLWQYTIPHEQKVVSNGSRIFFHDPESEQTTQLPPSAGFSSFLNQKPMTLKSNDFTIENIKNIDGIILVSISLKDEEYGNFSLKFSEKPLKLLSLSQGADFGSSGISIVFSNHRLNKNINDDIFMFKPAHEEIPE